ncbi:MAG: calcium/sodium antiporter [Moraxellaceae bacterium]|jgi:cation:H+ antiporter|nr:calcium/sodium antiporter [Moraxellaceae bacterium]MBP8852963.1 calcium/sodium antiporter [Moraxellaceae bacterium]MCC6200585.1 calcium/sodium antiporter [Moraxellaceae bacterium]HQV41716.1 calcium/sodium antiporter [Moraxellaceae bacterium]HQX89474.1 calcium/sodium antiporter [Moraxellaceae bacterium]
MDPITLGFFIFGLVLLTVGADVLVKGAAHLAGSLGISPLVVGLTVVAFGTSAPELAVSTASAWKGQADIAIGNVVGSNIFNVLFILGISALIIPLAVQQQLIRLDVPLMIAASVLLLLMGLDSVIGRMDGVILFSGLIIYTIFLIHHSRKESAAIKAEYCEGVDVNEDDDQPHWGKNIGYLLLGMVMLILGSKWLVEGAVMFARGLGVSELMIGLTIVAAGTSLPEVATSIMAALRGERDIAVGNVVGSNIFNILCVLGLSSIISPAGIRVADTALQFDIPVMIAVAAACLPIFFTGRIISRGNGAMLFGYYIAYTLYLVFTAQRIPATETLNTAMLWFVIPLTMLTLAIGVVRELRKKAAA